MRLIIVLFLCCSLSFSNAIFKKECSVCHGRKGNKHPLGRKVVITKFDENTLFKKIMAFKTAKNKRAFMAQNHERLLKPLRVEDIKNLAKHIKEL